MIQIVTLRRRASMLQRSGVLGPTGHLRCDRRHARDDQMVDGEQYYGIKVNIRVVRTC